MLRVVAGFVIIFCLISFGYSAYLYSLKTWLSVQILLTKIKSTKISSNNRLVFIEKVKKLNPQQVFTFILNLITLNSKEKKGFIFYAFPVAVILSIPSSVFRFSTFTTWLGFFCILITLLGLAKFLGGNFNGYWFDKINLYFLKLSILLLYSFGFFEGYLENQDNSLLFAFSLITTIVFSVYFLKSIIDSFNHIGFCVINFFLVYVFDLLAIGLYFGFFYLDNNEIFKLYVNIEQYNSLSLINLLSIIQTGLTNIYSLSTSALGFDSLKNFVPFFEYVFGAVFNAGIIGFFISYMASKIFKQLDKDNPKSITPKKFIRLVDRKKAID